MIIRRKARTIVETPNVNEVEDFFHQRIFWPKEDRPEGRCGLIAKLKQVTGRDINKINRPPFQYFLRNWRCVSYTSVLGWETRDRDARRFYKHKAVLVKFVKSFLRVRSISPILGTVIHFRRRLLNRRFAMNKETLEVRQSNGKLLR